MKQNWTPKRFPKETFQGAWLDPAKSSGKPPADPLAINGFDCVEIVTADAKATMYLLSHAFGFIPFAYRGPETGYPEVVSYVLRQGKVHLVVSAPLKPKHAYAAQVFTHGLTVRDVALEVPSCEAFYYEAMRRGATSVEAPTLWTDDNGTAKRAAIKTYGDTIHSIVERQSYKGAFWPGYVPYTDLFPPMQGATEVGLQQIDHVVGNVELGKMEEWVKFYERILGFEEMLHFSDKDISTEYSALMSKVVTDGEDKVKFPINEPAQGKRKSQIDEYLEFHTGPGVQHLAIRTDDIIRTVSEMRKRDVQFLYVPDTYYDDLAKRIGTIKENVEQIRELGILVDRDEDGYLLQLFTKPLHDRPTLFFEVIQRHGSRGFGKGNFKALFEAIERDQELRGNL